MMFRTERAKRALRDPERGSGGTVIDGGAGLS